MKYELLSQGDRGILIDRTPIFQDVRDTFEVSFLLPGEGVYLALFKDAAGVEYRKTVVSGAVKIPKEILSKEQYVGLVVCETDGERILRSWECEPIKVTALFGMRYSQWQLSGGMTERNCFDRLLDLERLHAWAMNELAGLKNEQAKTKEDLTAHLETISLLKKQTQEVVGNYNGAIDVVNDLSKRLKALEKNYDPTLID